MIRHASPRRAASAALVAALAATLALSGMVAAKDHPKPDKAGHGAKTEQVEGGTVKTGLKVKGNASHPGSVLRINAVLKAPRDLRPDTMEAVVHFATGDVTVELTQQGGGASYHAAVPVPDAEPEGIVLIDATAVVDGATLEATGRGKIKVNGTGDESEAAEPAEPAEPNAAETCEPDETPDASEAPEASDEPEASDSPDASASPEADETADESDDDCKTADDQASQLTAAVLAQIVAYLESLFG